MISDDDARRLTFLIKKKRAGLISEEELHEAISILNSVSKDGDLPVGIRATAGIVLANAIKRQKPRELPA